MRTSYYVLSGPEACIAASLSCRLGRLSILWTECGDIYGVQLTLTDWKNWVRKSSNVVRCELFAIARSSSRIRQQPGQPGFWALSRHHCLTYFSSFWNGLRIFKFKFRWLPWPQHKFRFCTYFRFICVSKFNINNSYYMLRHLVRARNRVYRVAFFDGWQFHIVVKMRYECCAVVCLMLICNIWCAATSEIDDIREDSKRLVYVDRHIGNSLYRQSVEV